MWRVVNVWFSKLHFDLTSLFFSPWQIENDVRQDFQCMSNVMLRTLHATVTRMLPIGIKQDDPEAWSLEQLHAALKQ